MILVAIENFVLLSTLLGCTSFVLAWSARRASESGWWHPHPYTLTRLYALALVVPPLVAAWLVAAALLPESWLGATTFEAAHPAPVHKWHLLGNLTATLEPVLAYATLVFAAAAVLLTVLLSVRGNLRVARAIERLEMTAEPPPRDQLALVDRMAAQRGFRADLVLSDYPFLFVWGFQRSWLVVSSGLLQALTPEELAGALEHEAAHHVRRDNLIKLILEFCGCVSLAFPLSWRLLRWRAEQIEMVCDEVAVARTSAPLEIAAALVKLRRLTLEPVGYWRTKTFTCSFVPEDAHSFERRVRRVIAFSDALPPASRARALLQGHAGAALLVVGVFALTQTAVSAFAPLAVHQATEFLIRFFK
ncbi:MAG: M56 family metallopeptidase [Acidobacteriota bacterium]